MRVPSQDHSQRTFRREAPDERKSRRNKEVEKKNQKKN
jgi:hypothetical protein